MTTKIIVLVADRGDPKHGELVVLDTTAEAERLVETFLEAGLERERIRVFAGDEMEAQISRRPRVELVSMHQDVFALPPDSAEEQEVQPAEALSEAHGAEQEPKNGSSPLFSSLRTRPAEPMPELFH
jgi:hypothetical protein